MELSWGLIISSVCRSCMTCGYFWYLMNICVLTTVLDCRCTFLWTKSRQWMTNRSVKARLCAHRCTCAPLHTCKLTSANVVLERSFHSALICQTLSCSHRMSQFMNVYMKGTACESLRVYATAKCMPQPALSEHVCLTSAQSGTRMTLESTVADKANCRL